MTKVSVFGQQPTETKELKKIEFVKCVRADGSFADVKNKPHQFDNVCLYCKSDNENFDAILAWDDHAEDAKSFYLGHWNDGIV